MTIALAEPKKFTKFSALPEVSRRALTQALKPKLTKYIPHIPTPKQQAFLWLQCRDAMYGGAAGGGKSDALLMAALQYVDVPGYAALLYRDTFKNLTKPEALMERAHEWLANTDAHWNGDKHRYGFPSGATLTFSHMDGPRAHLDHQSAAYQFIAPDEAASIRKNQALYMFSRLRRLKGSNVPVRHRCASNPPTREQLATGAWVKIRYVDPVTRKEGVVFIPAKLRDNPYLDEKDYILSLNELDPVTRAQLLEGDWDINVKGRMLERHWFPVVDAPPPDNEVTGQLRYWDMAATKVEPGKDPAYTAGPKIVRTRQGLFYMLDMRRMRENPGEVETIIRRTADQDGRQVKVAMEQEPGSSGKIVIDYYRRKVLQGYTFQGDRVTGPKEKRAEPFASAAEASLIMLVRGVWNKDFLDEAEVWPDGPYKDQIDSAAAAHRLLTQRTVQIL